jgi:alpha-L-fucosidase
MQIGYGPDANGQFHPLAVEALEYAGRWLQTNGEAIYGSRTFVHGNGSVSWRDSASGQVRYTRSKDNQTVFAIVLAGGSCILQRSSIVPDLQCVISCKVRVCAV